MLHLLRLEWRYVYCSARRDGWSRKVAARKFLREVWKGIPEIGKP